MSFHYCGDPSESDVDAVRFLVGDTVEAGAALSDEEIEWALTQESDPWYAAALLAESVAANYASKPTSLMIGETQITYGEAAQKWDATASRLRNSRRQSFSEVFGGGIYTTQKHEEESDSDREELAVTKGVHDNPKGVTSRNSSLGYESP